MEVQVCFLFPEVSVELFGFSNGIKGKKVLDLKIGPFPAIGALPMNSSLWYLASQKLLIIGTSISGIFQKCLKRHSKMVYVIFLMQWTSDIVN